MINPFANCHDHTRLVNINTTDASVEDGEQLWVRLKGKGTSPQSKKIVTIDVMDVCRFKDGKLIEHWGIPDRFALLHQSGALPPRPNN